MKNIEKRVIKTYKDVCRGKDENGGGIFSKKDIAKITQIIYTDGSYEPICEYLRNSNLCGANEQKSKKSKRGTCYRRKI